MLKPSMLTNEGALDDVIVKLAALGQELSSDADGTFMVAVESIATSAPFIVYIAGVPGEVVISLIG